MMSEHRLNKVSREEKSENLQLEMTFKQNPRGNRMRDNDVIIYSPVSNRHKNLSSLSVYMFSKTSTSCF